MSAVAKASRTQVWLETLGDWSWPGQGGAAVEFLPPSWVPAFPPRREAAVAGPAPTAWQPGHARARRLLIGTLLAALAAVCLALAQGGQLTLTGLIGVRSAGASEQEASAISLAPAAVSLPTLDAVSQDAAGSSIDRASYASAALHGEGSFLVYLPPATTARPSTTRCCIC